MVNSEIGNKWLKDFDGWNKHKKLLNDRQPPTFNNRDIWFSSLGANVGYEIDGKHENYERPILVVRKFSSNTFLGFPLSSQRKTGSHYSKIHRNNKDSWVLLNQGRIFDARRLLRRIYRLDSSQFSKVVADYKRLL